MNVTIELYYGPNRQTPTKAGMQRTIDALTRAIAKTNLEDSILLTDAKSIFIAMQAKLPGNPTDKI